MKFSIKDFLSKCDQIRKECSDETLKIFSEKAYRKNLEFLKWKNAFWELLEVCYYMYDRFSGFH